MIKVISPVGPITVMAAVIVDDPVTAFPILRVTDCPPNTTT